VTGEDDRGGLDRQGILALLGEADFVRLWVPGMANGLVRWLEVLAIGVYVFDRTGSPLLVALMTFARIAPVGLLSPVVGVLADRFDRRRMLLAVVGLVAISSTVLAWLAATDQLQIWQIALGAALFGLSVAMEFPVRRTLLGEVAGVDRLGPAVSLDSSTNNLSRMVGPILGGLALSVIGLAGAYLLSAALYAVSFVLVWRLEYRSETARSQTADILGNIVEGFRYIRSNRLVLGVVLITVVVNVFAFPFAVMVPVIGRDELQLSEILTGVLAAAEGGGAFVGAALLAFNSRRRHYALYFFYGSVGLMAAILCFSLIAGFWPALVFLLLAGLGAAGFTAMQGALSFTETPAEVRGRVSGLLAMCIGLGPLGVLYIGWLADWLGAPMAVTIMVAQGAVALALIGFWLREFMGRAR